MRKYVVLGNRSDWCAYSWTDASSIDNIEFYNAALPCKKSSLRAKMARVHYSQKIEKKIHLPLKKIWFHYFAKSICDNKNCELILIIYDRHILGNDVNFLKYVKKHFVHIKLVYLFTNVARISGASERKFLDRLNSYYDIVYAFDPQDSIKYSFYYSPLVYSLNRFDDIHVSKKVFYVGRAKDRYEMLIQIYKKLKNMNIPLLFYIANYDGDRENSEDIHYNQMISYKECLHHIQSSCCLVDVIQGESEGFTIKVCEAVYYDKLLITTNVKIKEAPFYNPDYIRVINSVDALDEKFFDNWDKVKYSDKDKAYFSVNSFINSLNRDLKFES